MKTIKINNYKMEKIADKMGKRFGKIKKGEEDDYSLDLFTMEANLLKTYRRNPECTSRRVIEAINILLLKIEEYLSDGIEYDFSRHLTEDNRLYVEALQFACDPFYSQKIKEVLKDSYDLDDKVELEEYFTIPVRCLIRIKESVELWLKQRGRNGYFEFLEGQIGSAVEGDELDFTLRIEDEDVIEETVKLENNTKPEENKIEGNTMLENTGTEESVHNKGNYLQQLMNEFPHIKAFSELDDWKWEEQAREFLNEGEFKKAEPLYKKLCLAQPKHHDGFAGLANVYHKIGEKEKAIWFMEQALNKVQPGLKDGSIDKEIVEELEEKYEEIKG